MFQRITRRKAGQLTCRQYIGPTGYPLCLTTRPNDRLFPTLFYDKGDGWKTYRITRGDAAELLRGLRAAWRQADRAKAMA